VADWDIDRSIPFIDTHHHLWELGRFPYRWLADPGTPGHNERLGDYKLIRTDWGPARLFREFYGQHVTGSVHVEGDSGAPDPVDETRWLDGVAREHGMPNAIVAFCDLERDDAPAQLDRHLEASGLVRGVRIRAHPGDPDSSAFASALKALEARDLSYELNASPGGLLSGLATAKANPGLQVILGHAGFPTGRDDAYFTWWKREISALAEADNVACKVSGLGMVDHDWTIDSIRPWVMHCVEAFGADRTMFGTNWPVDVLYSTYLQQVDAYRIIVDAAGFSRADQEGLLHRNAERYYRL
jgi:predicted TIM-barrel fold metal-dependent hydrolase